MQRAVDITAWTGDSLIKNSQVQLKKQLIQTKLTRGPRTVGITSDALKCLHIMFRHLRVTTFTFSTVAILLFVVNESMSTFLLDQLY